jgi:hypothetical protein
MPLTQRKGPGRVTGTPSDRRSSLDADDHPQSIRGTDNPSASIVGAGLRRRANALSHLAIVECPTCGIGTADPWTHRCADTQPSQAGLDAWALAADALLAVGLTPIVPAHVARELWRRGGEDRERAAFIAGRGGVVA